MAAQQILRHNGITYISLDWVVMGFTNGIPEYGVHDKLFPNEIADRIWNFVEAMCENIIWSELDVVVEGEAILPHSVRVLQDRHPTNTRSCFLGYADTQTERKVNEVKLFSQGDRDWLTNESDEYITQHIENMVQYSKQIRDECERYQLAYFDTSANFLGAVQRATAHLLGD